MVVTEIATPAPLQLHFCGCLLPHLPGSEWGTPHLGRHYVQHIREYVRSFTPCSP